MLRIRWFQSLSSIWSLLGVLVSLWQPERESRGAGVQQCLLSNGKLEQLLLQCRQNCFSTYQEWLPSLPLMRGMVVLQHLTRVMLQAANAASQGYKHILIIANDTDVVVLVISFFNEIGAEKLWVTFGKGKKIRPWYLQCHVSCKSMCSSWFSYPERVWQHIIFSGRNWHTSSGQQDQNSLCHLTAQTPNKVFESFVVFLYSATSP